MRVWHDWARTGVNVITRPFVIRQHAPLPASGPTAVRLAISFSTQILHFVGPGRDRRPPHNFRPRLILAGRSTETYGQQACATPVPFVR